MVVVVLTVFGPAAISVAILVFGREVARLGGAMQAHRGGPEPSTHMRTSSAAYVCEPMASHAADLDM
ncbi:hypothetical protein EYF80_062820 [Liparis tanakae]|uniref:Uncharacterized protein n=1 Tax=Liparis tanakae TaxID=230148 RepID=A0A4Z2EDS1_9TELE|nr:hypothetical protein EYF80_062820 [Liparis tanakae]